MWEEISSIVSKIYRADGIVADAKVRKAINRRQENGHGNLPVCIAKTQYSFSSDPTFRGAPDKHVLQIREIRLNAGAEFVVAVCGEIMTMPGLPHISTANQINIDDEGKEGKVVSLF